MCQNQPRLNRASLKIPNEMGFPCTKCLTNQSNPSGQISTSKYSYVFQHFSTTVEISTLIWRRINVEISTTVEISTLFRGPSKYSYVFQRVFDDRRNVDVDSTLNQRRKCPLGSANGVTCNRIMNMSTGSRCRILKHDSSDHDLCLCTEWYEVFTMTFDCSCTTKMYFATVRMYGWKITAYCTPPIHYPIRSVQYNQDEIIQGLFLIF